MTNEQLTKLAETHTSEISTLKKQVEKLIEFNETMLEFVQKLQE